MMSRQTLSTSRDGSVLIFAWMKIYKEKWSRIRSHLTATCGRKNYWHQAAFWQTWQQFQGFFLICLLMQTSTELAQIHWVTCISLGDGRKAVRTNYQLDPLPKITTSPLKINRSTWEHFLVWIFVCCIQVMSVSILTVCQWWSAPLSYHLFWLNCALRILVSPSPLPPWVVQLVAESHCIKQIEIIFTFILLTRVNAIHLHLSGLSLR